MKKTAKAKAIIKLLKQGYSPKEITQRMDASYNYAWTLQKELAQAKAAAKAAKTTTLSVDSDLSFTPEEVGVSEEALIEVAVTASQGRQERRRAAQDEAIARTIANRHEVPEHQQHLITEPFWDGVGDRVWCEHGIDQLGEMCEVCYPEAFGKVQSVDTILNDRATNYGSFLTMSKVTQRLKAVAHQFAGQHNKTFDADQAEALDLIFTKIGRILNGDPNHTDSWTDIAGYATLVADRLQGKIR
jgi:hypothetical protein